MPEPSKESLERARQWCFLQCRDGGDEIREALSNCQQCDPGSLYYVLASVQEESRQQNAALVSALREAVSLISGHGTSYQTYGELKRKWMAALAAHAPAEAEAKEKP